MSDTILPPPYAGPLGAHLGFWLRFVSNHVSHAFRLKLERHGVSVAEWACLRELAEHGRIAPSRLAVHLGMTRGGITKIADKLSADGLITRAADAHDGRSQSLALTARGKRLVPQLSALADANERECFGHLPPATVATLIDHLRSLAAHHGLRAIPLA